MKIGLFLVSIVVVMVSVTLSGCQQTNSVKTQTPQNVFLDSTIVEFANSSFQKLYNRTGGIDGIVVGWMFHNIAGRTINASINVKFYDKNNYLLYNEVKTISNLFADYTEQYYSPVFNRVTYNGPGAPLVDHVVITVTEIV
jgi:hypothetical protein